jgi:hypothetical protein
MRIAGSHDRKDHRRWIIESGIIGEDIVEWRVNRERIINKEEDN